MRLRSRTCPPHIFVVNCSVCVMAGGSGRTRPAVGAAFSPALSDRCVAAARSWLRLRSNAGNSPSILRVRPQSSPFFLAAERAKSDANVALGTWEKSRCGAHASHPRLFSRLHSRSQARSRPCPSWPKRSRPHKPPAQSPAPVLGPYKPVPITLPPAVNDPSFATFRNQLADIAKNKDRAALARIVAANFFWIPEDKDIADKQKSPIDN